MNKYQALCEELTAQLNALDEEHGDSNVRLLLLDELTASGLITTEPDGTWSCEGENYEYFDDLLENNPEFYEIYAPILEEEVSQYIGEDEEE